LGLHIIQARHLSESLGGELLQHLPVGKWIDVATKLLQVGCRRQVHEVSNMDNTDYRWTVTAARILHALQIIKNFSWRHLGELRFCSVKLREKEITRLDAEDCDLARRSSRL
jgi:hypothetical protein